MDNFFSTIGSFLMIPIIIILFYAACHIIFYGVAFSIKLIYNLIQLIIEYWWVIIILMLLSQVVIGILDHAS